VCDGPDESGLAQLPERLTQTGLFGGSASEQLAAGVHAYRPEFGLWSDGAEKRRWIWLPPGATIDSADPDDWSFPVGTKLWKEFTRDGTRAETRLLTRFGPGEADWIGASYVWTAAGDEAWLTPYGALDVAGTPHDVPASNECMACHAGTRSRVLGFSAIQLAHPAESDQVGIEVLNDAAWLSEPLELAPSVPGTVTERAALGYLHANCGHCHNQKRPEADGARCFDPQNELDFRLSVHSLGSVAETPTRHTLGKAVKAGKPEESRLIELMSNRGFLAQMPPLATERVDHDAVALLSDFIRGL